MDMLAAITLTLALSHDGRGDTRLSIRRHIQKGNGTNYLPLTPL